MGNDVSISQDELNNLFSKVEDLEPLEEEVQHIWLLKDKTTRAVVGGRCFSYFQAQNLLQKATKDYPDHQIEIIQYK